MPDPRQTSASPSQRAARDWALRRLSRLNRWLIAVSVVLTAVLAEVAAQAFPGKTIAATRTRQTSPDARAGGRSEGSPGPLRPPSQAPQAAPEAGEEQGSGSAPGQESALGQEPAPSQESAPGQEPAPSQQAAPSQEATPGESSPPAEPSGPVVSGGS
jgi:hypothetical protein